MQQLQKELTECGLSDSEAKIYLALLQNNNLKAGQIAKLTNIKRASTYTTLDSLTKKGLVSVSTDDGIFFFHAEPPTRIKEYLDNQQEKIKKKVQSLQKIQSDLNLLRQKELNIPKISIFTGESGVKTLLEQTLTNTKEPILVFGGYVHQGDPIPFYTNLRVSKGIPTKLITQKNKQALKEIKKDKAEFRKTYFMPSSYAFPGGIHISGNQVILFTYSNQQPVGVLIQDQDIAKMLTSIHKFVESKTNLEERKQGSNFR